jgi:hypothetical protein
LGNKKINSSTVFAGQAIGIKEVHDDIWLLIEGPGRYAGERLHLDANGSENDIPTSFTCPIEASIR